MQRRQFTLLALPAAVLAGCHAAPKPSLDATLLHNEKVREAVNELEQAMLSFEEEVGQTTAENWHQTLSDVQTATLRLRNGIDDLKRSLGYPEAG